MTFAMPVVFDLMSRKSLESGPQEQNPLNASIEETRQGRARLHSPLPIIGHHSMGLSARA